MLYLVPTPISEGSYTSPEICNAIRDCDYFVVEGVRTARRFISSLKLGLKIDELEFVELSEHTLAEDVDSILAPIKSGRRGVLMSEAGLPCVADPGGILVAAAHRAGVRVIPLVGASSLMLALMASGFSGQSFAFNSYLPIKPQERVPAIRHFEQLALGSKISKPQAQIFIETPYRNISLFEEFLRVLKPTTMLSISCDLTSKDEFIVTKSVSEWKNFKKIAEISKRPTIFIIYSAFSPLR